MADAPLLLGTFSFPYVAPGCDLFLAASYGRRCCQQLALPDAIRSEWYASGLRGVIDRNGSAYTFGVLLLSLGGQIEHDLIGSPNAFINSAVLSLFPIVMVAIGIIARTLSPRTALIAGALVSGLGMALLILAVNLRDLLIYLLATATAGGAYSLLFVGGLQAINAVAPERRRGGILSALYLLAYLSMGALALVLGAIATMRGLSLAVDLGAAAIILANVVTIVFAMRQS
jgi:MFS family permease